MSGESIRKPAVAGTFYPSRADELRRDIASYLAAVPRVKVAGRVVAAMAPHAGYRFSAPVAAFAYQGMRDIQADTLVIIGHDVHAQGVIAALSPADAFETPLGRVEVDTEMVAALRQADKRIIVHEGAHQRDHTIEVHLPFLQTLLPTCKIVPVLFGDPRPEYCRIFAEALVQAGTGKRLFVLASTDLSHYPTSTDAQATDALTVANVESMDIQALFKHLESARTEGGTKGIQTAMCASGGVGTAMLFAQQAGATLVQVLKRANSGDVAGGDTSRVVGYAAALFVRPDDSGKGATEAQEEQSGEFRLGADIQKELLGLARHRIRAALEKRSLTYNPPAAMKAVLETPAAVFVTLHKGGRLRGCIGMTEARMELWRAVHDMAFSAAFKDWRFSPVTEAELADLHIEISVLSPLKDVASAADIKPVDHGVVISQGGHRGLFLPQVWEQLPDKDRFLGVLCSEKAGLPENAWKDPRTELKIFTVFAFEEP